MIKQIKVFSSLVAQRLSVCRQCGRPEFDPWVGKFPWKRKWQPTPVFLPGESQGWSSLVGCSSWGRKELGHDWATSLTHSVRHLVRVKCYSAWKHHWQVRSVSGSVVSDSLQPHGLQTARLLHPWNFPGKNTRVDCHFLLQGIFPTQGSNPCPLRLLNWQTDSLLSEP